MATNIAYGVHSSQFNNHTYHIPLIDSLHRDLSKREVCNAFRLQPVQHTGGDCRSGYILYSDRFPVEPGIALPISPC